jgi:pSer/pThr/pTyr-binding forkhead associated (FHA) protein
MISKIIGRDPSCDYIIFDHKNRVSRKHAELQKNGNVFYIKDLNSTNGTCVNGNKIIPGQLFPIAATDKVSLSTDYPIDLNKVFVQDDATKVVPSGKASDATIVFDNGKATFQDGKKTVEFDRDKTQLSDILRMDTSPYITIGRNPDNKLVIDNSNISRYHCKIRLITPFVLEIVDLGSTNGSFADGVKLLPNKPFQFASSVQLRFGSSYQVNLIKLFPQVQIIKKAPTPPKMAPNPGMPNAPLSIAELNSFNELEAIWKEYIDRQKQVSNTATGYGIGGAVLGFAVVAVLAIPTMGASLYAGGTLAATAAATGAATAGWGTAIFGAGSAAAGTIASTGGGIIGRYLGQQKSNEIKNDITYEEMFLKTYACPRCKESFQKKPWVTIRECFKCKSKFRE